MTFKIIKCLLLHNFVVSLEKNFNSNKLSSIIMLRDWQMHAFSFFN